MKRYMVAGALALGAVMMFVPGPAQADQLPWHMGGDEAAPLCTGGGARCAKDSECCSGRCVRALTGFDWCGYEK